LLNDLGINTGKIPDVLKCSPEDLLTDVVHIEYEKGGDINEDHVVTKVGSDDTWKGWDIEMWNQRQGNGINCEQGVCTDNNGQYTQDHMSIFEINTALDGSGDWVDPQWTKAELREDINKSLSEEARTLAAFRSALEDKADNPDISVNYYDEMTRQFKEVGGGTLHALKEAGYDTTKIIEAMVSPDFPTTPEKVADMINNNAGEEVITGKNVLPNIHQDKNGNVTGFSWEIEVGFGFKDGQDGVRYQEGVGWVRDNTDGSTRILTADDQNLVFDFNSWNNSAMIPKDKLNNLQLSKGSRVFIRQGGNNPTAWYADGTTGTLPDGNGPVEQMSIITGPCEPGDEAIVLFGRSGGGGEPANDHVHIASPGANTDRREQFGVFPKGSCSFDANKIENATREASMTDAEQQAKNQKEGSVYWREAQGSWQKKK
jgi:hypothetical protein